MRCSVSRAPRLLVATSQGVLYVYALDAAEGGECALLRHHALLEPPHAPHAPHSARDHATNAHDHEGTSL